MLNNYLQTRLKAIRRMEDALASAARLGEPETTEVSMIPDKQLFYIPHPGWLCDPVESVSALTTT